MAASFVREVLSATGKLAEKEDLSAKLARLQSTLRTHQTNIGHEVESKYVSFDFNLSSLSSSVSISSLESLLNDAEALRVKLRVHLGPQLDQANDELQTLNNKLNELQDAVQATMRLKGALTNLESARECLDSKKLCEAASKLNAVEQFIEGVFDHCKCDGSYEDDVPAGFEGVRGEHSSLLAELQSELYTRFDSMLHLATHEEENNAVVFVLNTEGLDDLAGAMQTVDLLDLKLNNLGVKILQQIITPMLSAKVEVALHEDEHLQVERVRLKERRVVGQQDIGNVHQLLAFVQSHLGSVNIGAEGEKQESLASRLSLTFSSKLVDMLIEECIIERIPNGPNGLGDFSDKFVPSVQLFNQFLTDYNLLATSDRVRLAESIEDHYVMIQVGKKRCASILDEARSLMKEDLHLDMTEAHVKTKQALNKQVLRELPSIVEEALPLPDNFSWEESFFTFPKCQISGHTTKLCELIDTVLEEALKCRHNGQNDLTQELLVAAQSSLELYCIVVPLYHEDSLSQTPLNAALVHNNCLYLAHFCVLLVLRQKHLFTDNEKNEMALIGFGPDLVSRLRQVGVDIFRQQLRVRSEELLGVVKQLRLDVSQSVFAANEKLVRQILHMLKHLRRVWWQPTKSVMAATPFQKAMGQLVDTVLKAVVHKVLCMEDISADASKEIAELCHILIDQVPKLMSLEDDDINLSHVVRFIPSWNRFNELELVLNAGLRQIDERWACGQGPMANEMSAEEAKSLVRALFQNTDIRAQVLSRIK